MATGTRGAWRCAWLGALATLAFPLAAGAVKLQFTPRVTVSETFSDNVRLAPRGQEQHEFITQVSPGISIQSTDRRLSVAFDYQVSGVHYARGTSGSRLDHRMQLQSATGDSLELIDNHLFLDYGAKSTQRNVSSQGRLSTDTTSATGNIQNVYSFQASPYWRQRFGQYADAVLRLNGALIQNSGGATDTDVSGVTLAMTSGKEFAVLPWTLTASYDQESNSTGTTNTFRSVSGSTRYQFTRRYGMRLSAGYRSTQTVSASGGDDTLTWALTGIWTPTERTSVEAGFQHNVAGNSVLLDLTHRMRKAVFALGYQESQTTTARRQLEQQVFALVDPFGEPIEDPGLRLVGIPIDEPDVTDETLISRRFDGSMSVRGRRTSGTARLYHERRSFEFSGSDETVFGASVSGSRSLSRHSSASVTGNWQRSEFANGEDSTLYSVGLTYSRSIYRDLRAGLTYRHSRTDSSVSSNEFTENRLSATLTMLF